MIDLSKYIVADESVIYLINYLFNWLMILTLVMTVFSMYLFSKFLDVICNYLDNKKGTTKQLTVVDPVKR